MFRNLIDAALNEEQKIQSYSEFEECYMKECGYASLDDLDEDEKVKFTAECKAKYESYCAECSGKKMKKESVDLDERNFGNVPQLNTDEQIEAVNQMLMARFKGMKFRIERGRGTTDYKIFMLSPTGIELGYTTNYFSDWQKNIALGGETTGAFSYPEVYEILKSIRKDMNRRFGNKNI